MHPCPRSPLPSPPTAQGNRAATHTPRRQPGTPRGSQAALLLCGLALTLAACDQPSTSIEEGGQRTRDEWGIPLDAPVSTASRDQIGLLIQQFRPLDATLTSDHHDRWLADQRSRIDRVISQGEGAGNAALHAYTGAAEEPYLVRRALLWTGGLAAPENARELLHNLFITYGSPIADRTEAALVLSLTSPRLFFSDAKPILERTKVKRQTLPDDEFLVRGWINACLKTGESPVPMLAQVATNLRLDPPARWQAAKRMREFPLEPIGQRALESCLVESSGDGYLRRMSAQSLRELLPSETACALFAEVARRESDSNFRAFLLDMMQRNCRGLLLDAEGLIKDPDPLPNLSGEQDGR